MPLEEVIAGFTGIGFATTPPTIPGLQALGIFGTTKDGKNTNRAAGGPAFFNLTNPPTMGSAWITVNNGTTATPTQGIDSGVQETAAVVSSGWTMFCVARYLAAPGNGTVMGIGTGQSSALILNPANTNVSSHPSVWLSCQGLTFTGAEATIDLGAGVSQSAWRMYGLSYPAGAGARVYTLYDVTGNASKTTTTTHSRTGTTSNHVTFGHSGGVTAAAYVQTDLSVGGFATGVLSLAQLGTIRTWLQGVLAVRGVTGF